MPFALRFAGAAFLHLALALGAGGLLLAGHPLAAIPLQALLAALQTAMVLAFGTLPFPVRPSALQKMDFAAIDWLPHVAVTRLAHVRGAPGAHSGTSMLRNASFLTLPHALLAWATLARHGWSQPASWLAAGLGLYAILLSLALLGRSRARARGGLPPGSIIS